MKLKKQQKNPENRSKKFVIVHSNRTLYGFNKFKDLNNFELNIF